ncbi:DUF3857 domain-containing protein [uncultured Lutibacter sp.]|uniref:DUF3857 domain-containing protein n=1 Tax=uncultured Lutibacter sp. TaxID=437739 RepID=UPI0026077CDF|nr:DUF3857 domain-containing protein [uncultured Lutibacter sp.]
MKFPIKFAMVALLLYSTVAYTQDYNFDTSKIPEKLVKNANSIIRFENVAIDIKSQKEMIIKIEKAITIYNKLASNYEDIIIFHDKGTVIKSVKAYVYNSEGKEIKKIKKSDLNDYSASGTNLYTDNRVLYYNYVPTTYPFTIHYSYEIKTSNTAFINPWLPIESYRQSVQKSVYSLKYPSNINIRKSERNFTNYNIEVAKETNKISYKLENIAAVELEPYAPPFKNFMPNVKFGVNKFNLEGINGEANNWEEFGKWYYENLLQSTFDLPEVTKQEVKNLTENTNSPIEKAKIIYNYVQDKVRYISVQVGIGGFKPMLASEVDDLSYGDCKALSNYTKTLLDAVGVESNYTVIYGGPEKRNIDNEFLSVQGNHVILNIPTKKGDLWLECTSQKTPFADIGGFTDDRDALVITPEGGKIKHTRIYKDSENYKKISGKYVLNNEGSIKADINMISSGTQFVNHLSYEGKTEKELDKLYKEFWSNINNVTIENIAIRNNKKIGEFEESVKFGAENYGVITGERMIFPINAFNVTNNIPKRINNRKMPIEVARGFLNIDEVEVELPINYEIETISNDYEIECEFGIYKLSIEKLSESKLKYKREFLFKNGLYPKEYYDEYREFWRKIAKNDKSKIVLIKKNI